MNSKMMRTVDSVISNNSNDLDKAIQMCVGNGLTEKQLIELKNLMTATVKISVLSTLSVLGELSS